MVALWPSLQLFALYLLGPARFGEFLLPPVKIEYQSKFTSMPSPICSRWSILTAKQYVPALILHWCFPQALLNWHQVTSVPCWTPAFSLQLEKYHCGLYLKKKEANPLQWDLLNSSGHFHYFTYCFGVWPLTWLLIYPELPPLDQKDIL